MINDPVADFLTRIRNGLMVKKKTINANASKMTSRLAEILRDKGYIDGYQVELGQGPGNMVITLRYDANGKPILEGLRRISKPGLRIYCGAQDLPVVRGDMGFAVISTSKGVMTSEDAKKLGLGGEILCHVW